MRVRNGKSEREQARQRSMPSTAASAPMMPGYAGVLAADTTSTTAALWFTLAGALGGVLFTGAFALLNSILGNRWQEKSAQLKAIEERTRLLRQERREAYAAYWAA